MSEMLIYLSGAMSGLSFEERNGWRARIEDEILKYEMDKVPVFFNPVMYYGFEGENYRSEKEVFEFDLYQLRKSDLMIVNFNEPNSIGTAMEIMLAKELRIPIIGLNEGNVKLHPWLEECVTRMCYFMNEIIEYVIDYYLN